MPRSVEQIHEMLEERKKATGPMLEAMREIRNHVDGDIIVPLPEMDRAEKPAVANLIAEAIDQIGMRVASTLPYLDVPPLDPRKPSHIANAQKTRMAVAAWWEENRIRRILRRRARYLVAYATAPVMLRPDFENGIPRWYVRDPLQTYPHPTEFFDDDSPVDCIFSYGKPYQWLRYTYPDAARRIAKPSDCKPSTMFEIIEYVDHEEIVLAVCGKRPSEGYGLPVEGEKIIELERIPNRADICLVVSPKRITIGKLCGQFNQVLGLYQHQARLMALDLIAVTKAVFPDLAIIGTGNGTPQLLGDEWKDGRTGEINMIQNGDVKVIQPQPGFRTSEAMDRLERGQRMAGVPAQMTGETPTGIRTGRASEITMSAHVDFRIQEYQEALADSLQQENKRAIAIAKAYFGNRPKSFHVGLPKLVGRADYIPNKHFTTDKTRVHYPMPGADLNAAIIGIGQRVGMGLISRKAAMELDPLIDEPELMHDQLVAERMEMALLDGLSQMAAQGAIPPNDIARIQQLVTEQDMPLSKAVMKAHEEAQERQARLVEQNDPAARPGLAVPGTGAEAGVAIPEPTPSAQNLARLLYTLRQPAPPAGGGAVPLASGAEG